MEAFEGMLHGLAELDDDGYIAQTYCVMLRAEGTSGGERHMRLLAESLHQRWLSDMGFAPTAARLAAKLADLRADDGDATFESVVYALLINDYSDRRAMCARAPSMLCNSAQFAFEFYDHFHERDPLYRGLVDILLDYLDMLVGAECTTAQDADGAPVELASRLLQHFGARLQSLRYKRMQSICLAVRRIVVCCGERLSPAVRCRLLEIIELSQCRWDADALPAGVAHFYEAQRRLERARTDLEHVASTASMRSALLHTGDRGDSTRPTVEKTCTPPTPPADDNSAMQPPISYPFHDPETNV